eukprot:TRINITY_DN8227_c0_g1_i4.p1 TRINITY_DN8227_c0_g1~~TRINITY_DN8227_c0_g1_i4.p1  ORF type:complete len:217 (-),score=58.94 TRINITY_DN8227_c0_g1_i4:152-802(-)
MRAFTIASWVFSSAALARAEDACVGEACDGDDAEAMRTSLLQTRRSAARAGELEQAAELQQQREAILRELSEIDAELAKLDGEQELVGHNKEYEGPLHVKGGCLRPYSMGSVKFSTVDCDSAPKWMYYKKYNVLLAPNGYCLDVGHGFQMTLCQHSNGDYEKDKFHFEFERCVDNKCTGTIMSLKKDKCLQYKDDELSLAHCHADDNAQHFTIKKP